MKKLSHLGSLLIVFCLVILSFFAFSSRVFAEDQGTLDKTEPGVAVEETPFFRSPESNGQINQSPSADTYISSGFPGDPHGEQRGLWVGYSRGDNYLVERGLLRFQLSNLPQNAVISSATLQLTFSGSTLGSNSMVVNAYRTKTSEWLESTTWNQSSNLQAVLTPFATVDLNNTKLNQTIEWDVKPLLADWLHDPEKSSQFSLVLKGNENVGQHDVGFWSRNCKISDCGATPGKRPQLQVIYTTPTPVPTISTTPTPIPGNSCSCAPSRIYKVSGNYPQACSAPDSRNGRSSTHTYLGNNETNFTFYYCANGGVPTLGNCSCSSVNELVQTDLKTERECLGENSVYVNRCVLSTSSYPSISGSIYRWEEGKCHVKEYNCGNPTPTPALPMEMPVYAENFTKVMSGGSSQVDLDIDANGVKDLRDFWALWNKWKLVPTPTRPV